MNTIASKKFNGATLVNLMVAQSIVHRTIQTTIDNARLNLNPLELHILAALLEKDGVFASVLAARVGRAATSFTPSLDRLQKLGFIERRPDAGGDRRAVNIYLTDLARACGDLIKETLAGAEDKIRKQAGVSDDEWAIYFKVVAALQNIEK